MKSIKIFKYLLLSFSLILFDLGLNSHIILAETNSLNHKEGKVGKHGGRLLGREEFQAEVTIYEPNIPAQSRVYFYKNGKIIDPSDVELKMELHRLNKVDTFSYTKQENYLIGDKIVDEPHSFDVKIYAKYNGKLYKWEYASHEGRTTLSPQAIKSAGIKTELAGPKKLKITKKLFGKIVPNDYRTLHVTPRFSGVVKKLKKELGDKVKKGEIIAIMESNESLSEYSLKSKIDGVIIERNVSPGEVVSVGQSIYVVSDLNTVWADFKAYSKDLPDLKKGQNVLIVQDNIVKSNIEAQISYISPIGDEDTQMFLVRTLVENRALELKPGLFVLGKVVIAEPIVPVAVRTSALQTFRDWNVVFRKKENIFEIAIIELGRRDGNWVEVLSGLDPNKPYVTENSFVIKADILKSGAAHHHH